MMMAECRCRQCGWTFVAYSEREAFWARVHHITRCHPDTTLDTFETTRSYW